MQDLTPAGAAAGSGLLLLPRIVKAVDIAAIAGDAEEAADKIRLHNEALGITHYMGAFSRGGPTHETVTRSMRLFAEKVMPRFA